MDARTAEGQSLREQANEVWGEEKMAQLPAVVAERIAALGRGDGHGPRSVLTAQAAAATIAMQDVRPDARDMASFAGMAILMAQPFWVSAECVSLTIDASPTFPQDWRLREDALVAPQGFVYLDEWINLSVSQAAADRVAGQASDTLRLEAFWWVLGEGRVQIWFLGFWQGDLDRPKIEGVGDWLIGESIHDLQRRYEREHSRPHPAADDLGRAPWMQLMGAFWSLINDRIFVVSTDRPSRQVRRAAARQDRTLEPVKVVKLRRQDFARRAPAAADAPDWQHRWIVRGHWHEYWVGPRDGDRHLEPRWVDSYIKGPDGKPLRAPDRIVFSFER